LSYAVLLAPNVIVLGAKTRITDCGFMLSLNVFTVIDDARYNPQN